MKNKLGDRARLQHILDAIFHIEFYTEAIGYEEFNNNSMIHFVCIKQLEIIDEAANRLTPEFKTKEKKIPWKEIISKK